MAVPYTFGSATSAIPLSQLDSNFATTITLGNTAIQLGNTVTTLNNMTLANVTVSSVASAITVAQGGTGQTTLTTAYGVLCAGTTATGAVQTLNSLGTSGQVLTSNGAAALPSFQAIPSVSGASLVFIQSQTASSSATLDFTTGITSTYDEYLFTLTSVVPATDGSSLIVRVSEDSGSTWVSSAVYSWATNGTNDSGGAASTGTVSDTSMVLAASGVSNTAADGGYNGELRVFNPAGTSAKKVFTALGGYYRTTSTIFLVNAMSGRYKGSNNAINGIRFLFGSGNITSGTISLYGVKKS